MRMNILNLTLGRKFIEKLIYLISAIHSHRYMMMTKVCKKCKLKEEEYKQYIFGTIVQNKNGPAYKIEKNGKITVYTNIVYKRASELVQETFQSTLKLEKIRAINANQILIVKADLLGKQLHDRTKELQKVKDERNALRQTINAFQQEKQRLKQKQINPVICQNCFNCKNELRFKNLVVKKAPKIPFIDSSSPYYAKFQIKGTTIKYISNEATAYQLLFNEVIPQNKIYIFEIKLARLKSGNIIVGVADRKAAKNNQSPPSLFNSNKIKYQNNEAIGYFMNNKNLYPMKINQCRAKQGQTLLVIVDLDKGSLQYRVSGELRAVDNYIPFYIPLLLDKNRQFVPYIQMYDKDDFVQWMGSEEIEEGQQHGKKQEQQQKALEL